MMLYRTREGVVARPEQAADAETRSIAIDWDQLATLPDLESSLAAAYAAGRPVANFSPADALVPLQRQEVWAAGVTYFRSRDARMAESADAGGGSFYDRVYSAPRPELFYKGGGRTAVGSGEEIAIRADTTWNVPEPELVLFADSGGRLIGYTVGNDVSSRDIEGENPLYLPQAKVYDASCALGPGLLVTSTPLPTTTEISLAIARDEAVEFAGTTTLAELKRSPDELLEYLYRHNTFTHGCFLMTGTGIVPPDGFTLQADDVVTISIAGVGILRNRVAAPSGQR
jgi:2-dehydro-3-deoxy-D-arabinonate dehydratase